MQEINKDAYSNQCMTEATKLVTEAKIYLKNNKLKEAVINDYNGIVKAMKAILAVDDEFPDDDYATEKAFRTHYVDNGLTSDELRTTLDKILEYIEHINNEPGFKVGKPDAGYFTSKANFFVLEVTDYIVQRNALYWGQ